jgi:hypothetical protein
MMETNGLPVAILVLGMHRSGTSAVTGVLDKLGIPVPGEMLPAASDNPKGFFENKASFEFNHNLLNHFASRWDDPLAIALENFEASGLAAPFEDALATIIEREFLGTSIFALKDPSLCRFLPIWHKVLERVGVATRPLIALRHPVEVAGSLKVRDGLPRAKTFLIWLQHMLPAERQTRGMIRTFLSYDGLMADWRAATGKAAAELGLAWPLERARVEASVDDFLSRDLRHHVAPANFGGDAAATGLEALAARAWTALQALARDRDDAAAMAELDRVAEILTNASAIFAPYVAWEFRALLDSRERVAWLEEIERVVRAESADYFQQIAVLNEVIAGDRVAAEAKHRQLLLNEQRSHRQALERTERELRAAQTGLERGTWFERRTVELEAEVHRLSIESHHHALALNALEGSTAWRITGPFRRAAGALPPSLRAQARRLVKTAWWGLTPWRMPARLRFLRERDLRPAEGPGASSPVAPDGPPPALATRYRRGANALPALGLFEVPALRLRVSMVTDSINEGSLFGGVATALIFTALLAQRTGRRLRIVTRTQAPAAENVAVVFRAHGIDWTDNIEFVFADIADEDSRIETHADELFVTTSWWTTRSTRQSVADAQILYILQEDERMFYPFGDDQLACAETLKDRAITKVINSGLLHRHLVADGVIDETTPFFEPSFPDRIYFPAPEIAENGKRNFFFYARPYNARNLYDRGVAVIEAAIERGILDPALWNIHFVGKDLQPVQLAGGVEPILLQNLAWEDYAAFVRSVDLALTLMYTPHPSYPPLDVAACGGVAVTNAFGLKTDLSAYSRSIIVAASEVETLVEALRQGVKQALDEDGRRDALAGAGIGRDWAASFAPVLDRLTESGPSVR